jgi:hypothetical protein
MLEKPEKKSLNLELGAILPMLKRVAEPVKKHHALILFLLLMSVVIYSVINVSSIIQMNEDPEYRATAEAKSIKTSFDQATIKKVNELRQSSDNTTIALPGGRRNPFVD